MEKNLLPLENDVITQLLYAHDDEITEIVHKLLALEERVRELEEKSSQEVVK